MLARIDLRAALGVLATDRFDVLGVDRTDAETCAAVLDATSRLRLRAREITEATGRFRDRMELGAPGDAALSTPSQRHAIMLPRVTLPAHEHGFGVAPIRAQLAGTLLEQHDLDSLGLDCARLQRVAGGLAPADQRHGDVGRRPARAAALAARATGGRAPRHRSKATIACSCSTRPRRRGGCSDDAAMNRPPFPRDAGELDAWSVYADYLTIGDQRGDRIALEFALPPVIEPDQVRTFQHRAKRFVRTAKTWTATYALSRSRAASRSRRASRCHSTAPLANVADFFASDEAAG